MFAESIDNIVSDEIYFLEDTFTNLYFRRNGKVVSFANGEAAETFRDKQLVADRFEVVGPFTREV